MRNQKGKTSEQIARNQRVTLLELLDRLLDRGVVVKGEILLSVADIDLVYLNLGLLLSSVKTVERAAGRSEWRGIKLIEGQPSTQKREENAPLLDDGKQDIVSPPLPKENSQRGNGDEKTRAGTLPSAISNELNKISETKNDINHDDVEKGLFKLVLTLVDLIRKLMEKQAIRRIEDNQLSNKEIEEVGNTFLLLDEKMSELKRKFGLKDEDLNLDLGPLGDLV